jgi:hypothetical protein
MEETLELEAVVETEVATEEVVETETVETEAVVEAVDAEEVVETVETEEVEAETTEESEDLQACPESEAEAEVMDRPSEPEMEVRPPELQLMPRADLKFKCSCGFERTLAEDTTGAVQYIIPATDQHTLEIQCENCGTKFTIYWEEHIPTEVEDVESLENMDITEEEAEEINAILNEVELPTVEEVLTPTLNTEVETDEQVLQEDETQE